MRHAGQGSGMLKGCLHSAPGCLKISSCLARLLVQRSQRACQLRSLNGADPLTHRTLPLHGLELHQTMQTLDMCECPALWVATLFCLCSRPGCMLLAIMNESQDLSPRKTAADVGNRQVHMKGTAFQERCIRCVPAGCSSRWPLAGTVPEQCASQGGGPPTAAPLRPCWPSCVHSWPAQVSCGHRCPAELLPAPLQVPALAARQKQAPAPVSAAAFLSFFLGCHLLQVLWVQSAGLTWGCLSQSRSAQQTCLMPVRG